MKPFITLLVSVAIMQLVVAQPTLTHDSHALLPGMDNPMTLCKFVDPGVSGDNVTWDFSNLEVIEKFTGNINHVIANSNFSEANVELDEFGTKFLFYSDDNSIQQVGYTSKDLRTVVHYNQPYEKMVFPLSRGDNHNCTFSGSYSFDGKLLGDINGTGTIDADAWGTIKLPNGKVYENTLRIKSVKSYTLTFNGQSSQDVEIVTYRWYNSIHRYPLLVLTEYTTKSGDNTSTNYQAAYNNNAVSELITVDVQENLNLYPNPVSAELNLYYYSDKNKTVRINICDISGKELQIVSDRELVPGENIISLSSEISNLKPATYILKVISGDKIETRSFILTK